MVKKISHTLPCGAVYEFKEYNIYELVDVDTIIEKISKEKLRQVTNFEWIGRKYRKAALRLGTMIIRLFFKKIIDRLMESNRFVLPYNQYMYIGRIPENPKRIAKKRKKEDFLFHTGGKRYGLIFTALPNDYYMRMPFRRRKELAQRIKEGQKFLG